MRVKLPNNYEIDKDFLDKVFEVIDSFQNFPRTKKIIEELESKVFFTNKYIISAESRKALIDTGLLQENGEVSEDIKNIIYCNSDFLEKLYLKKEDDIRIIGSSDIEVSSESES